MKRRRNSQLINLAQPSSAIGFGLLALCIGLMAALLLLEKIRPNALAELRSNSTDIASPIARTLAAPQDSFVALSAGIRSYFTTHADNKRLKEENATLLKWQSLAHQYARENEQLRILLQVVPESKEHYVSARMVSAYGDGTRNIALISAGKEDGIKKNLAVIAPEGLVGRVIEVGKHNSRVLLINDVNANIPVFNERSGQKAILTGRSGNELKLELLDQPEVLRVGDRFVTSGDGGLIPSHIPAASITSISGSTVIAAPMADIHRSTMVTVVDYGF